jgi:hypothetical protein
MIECGELLPDHARKMIAEHLRGNGLPPVRRNRSPCSRDIAGRTVKTHLGTIFDKSRVRSRPRFSLKVNGLRA